MDTPSTFARLTVLVALVVGWTSPTHADKIVRGGGGQPHLRLDYGRSLARYAHDREPRRPFTSIERARLEARRLLRQSTLSTRAAVEQIVDLVRRELPHSPDATYDAFNERVQAGDRPVALSTYVEGHVGICRERAFLLAKMLRDGGLVARAKYGVIYDRKGNELSGHAWVETKIDGRPARIDPSVSRSVSVGVRRLSVTQVEDDGRSRTVQASRSHRWLYVPEAVQYLRLR